MVVARLGGKEFVLLLVETDQQGAFTLAERLRQQIQQLDFSSYDMDVHVTTSFGIVSCNEQCESFDQVLVNADKALYDAKRSGRNQTKIFQSSD